ncbi:hypothetical protein [Marivita geojedonensis]|uniref:Uncharacterized protein n=1 Tax=Marivita geojedonensis TaxID=1123756 RepID=A0A1X4NNW2_9RHOB|nr:hypothetical protein [Marivita geojedonensis]OSQ52433.1 hypothetical protein MGEO_03345 [Marivita geojedonensis]PRY73736.1 hypothetical protein CLV76_1299 [Marivita geojedonensis]
MTSIAKSTAFVATFALSVTVGISELQAAPKNCPAITFVDVNGEQIELPADTAAQVTMLQQYGTRYVRVIDLIIEENAKPEWTFLEDCGPQGADALAMTE